MLYSLSKAKVGVPKFVIDLVQKYTYVCMPLLQISESFLFVNQTILLTFIRYHAWNC